ncbi:MAG: hypothetical protein ABIR91_01905 [Candidatus Saccharimonadales bacterium]
MMSVFCALWVTSTPTQALGLVPVIRDVTAPAVQLVRGVVALPQRQPSPIVEVSVTPTAPRAAQPARPATSTPTTTDTSPTAVTVLASSTPSRSAPPVTLEPVASLSLQLGAKTTRSGDVLSAATTASMVDSGRWTGWMQVSPAGWVILGILWPYWLGLIAAGWWFRRSMSRRLVASADPK